MSSNIYCLNCSNITSNPKFCSKSCSAKFSNFNRKLNGYEMSKENRISIGNKAKNNNNNSFRKKRLECIQTYAAAPNPCSICGNILEYEKRKNKTCSELCKRTFISLNSIKKGNGGFKHTHIMYGNISMDSSWEVKLAKSLDENMIEWIRPKGLKFIDRHGIERRYHADFYLPAYNVYLDPKNPYALKVQKEKLEDIKNYLNINLLILSENQLNWDTIYSLLVRDPGIEPGQ